MRMTNLKWLGGTRCGLPVALLLLCVQFGCSRQEAGHVSTGPEALQGRLERAISDQDYDGVKSALADGARADHPLSTRLYPLGAALQKENVSIVRLLLRRGADPNGSIADFPSGPALSGAATAHSRALVDELCAAGADPNRRFGEGLAFTPLGIAATSGSGVAPIAGLIDAGADPDARILVPPSAYPLGYRAGRAEGKTALMLAAASGLAGNVTALLNGGADPSLRDERGKTALDLMGDPTTELREVLRHPERYMVRRVGPPRHPQIPGTSR